MGLVLPLKMDSRQLAEVPLVAAVALCPKWQSELKADDLAIAKPEVAGPAFAAPVNP